MKLLRLKLNSDFRSLTAGFEVDFLREWDRDRFDEFHPYCLAGRNGSGKSNVIDAMLFVFGKKATKMRLKNVCSW